MPETPVNDDLLHAAGPLLLGGRPAEAEALLRRHLRLQPGDARGWGLLGRALREQQRLDEAGEALGKALQQAPDFPAALLELGLLQRARGALAEAEVSLRRCLAIQPDNLAARWELANLLALQAPEEAWRLVEALRRARPADPSTALLEAELQRRTGRLQEAREGFLRLRQAFPDHLGIAEGLLRCLQQLEDWRSDRLALAELLARSDPGALRWLDLATERQHAGDLPGAHAALDAALESRPDCLPARWLRFQLPREVAPADEDALRRFREDWDAGLSYFEALDFADPALAEQAWPCLIRGTAFHRHYLGDEVLEPQRRFGRLVGRMLATQATPGPLRPLRAGRRRIGFCSGHFREHTVSRLFAPLIERLDRARFEVHVFSLEDTGDRWSQALRRGSQFHAGRGSLQQWRERIEAAELDVLVYPEIGMHPLALALAASRLAPVQAALWGHPVTTGLEHIDLFLSAEALEPEGADRHYSEHLLRLPGLGHGLRSDDLPEPTAPPLEGLGEMGIDLLCAQTAVKLLPGMDRLFARILAQLPEARLHLLADHRAAVRERLFERMAGALRAAGAEPQRQLRVHGFLDHAAYLGLARAVQLNLDSVGWSGGMSAMDLLAQGLPTVCLPGSSMRGQQTARLLRWLGVPEPIARDEDDYVRLATQLARDEGACLQLRRRLLAARARLFADSATQTALEALLAGIEREGGRLIIPGTNAAA